MDCLIWIVLAVTFVFGLLLATRRRPPPPPGPGAGRDPVEPSHVIRVDLADRDRAAIDRPRASSASTRLPAAKESLAGD